MRVKISQGGGIDTRLYLKPQKKPLILGSKSYIPNLLRNKSSRACIRQQKVSPLVQPIEPMCNKSRTSIS